MSQSHRVIITGVNEAGKSVVAEDVQAPLSGPGNFDFWQTKPGQSPHDLAFGRSPMKFYPQPGGTMFRLFTIRPRTRAKARPTSPPFRIGSSMRSAIRTRAPIQAATR